MNGCCLEHSGHKNRLDNLEGDIVEVKKENLAAHRRIDGMKNWVIAGMTSLVLQLIVVIGALWIKTTS